MGSGRSARAASIASDCAEVSSEDDESVRYIYAKIGYVHALI
jgi:hypothetical protein